MIHRNEPLRDIIVKVMDAYQRSGEGDNSFSRYLEREFMQGEIRPASQSKQYFIETYLLTDSHALSVISEERETKRQGLSHVGPRLSAEISVHDDSHFEIKNAR